MMMSLNSVYIHDDIRGFQLMPPGTAEDDRVLPKTKNPYFLENYFTIFRNPPTPNALKIMKSRKFFTQFEKNIEIPINFHQNQCEKRRI